MASGVANCAVGGATTARIRPYSHESGCGGLLSQPTSIGVSGRLRGWKTRLGLNLRIRLPYDLNEQRRWEVGLPEDPPDDCTYT